MPATLTITPDIALIDVPRHIKLAGFAAGTPVVLTLTSRQIDGQIWRSENTYLADEAGNIDVASQAPTQGSYAGVDAQGPIWSQSVLSTEDDDARLVPAPAGAAGAVHTVVTAKDEQGNQAQARFEQHYAGPGVTRTELDQDGLVGALYVPLGHGPHPAIVVLNGSGGGPPNPLVIYLLKQASPLIAPQKVL